MGFTPFRLHALSPSFMHLRGGAGALESPSTGVRDGGLTFHRRRQIEIGWPGAHHLDLHSDRTLRMPCPTARVRGGQPVGREGAWYVCGCRKVVAGRPGNIEYSPAAPALQSGGAASEHAMRTLRSLHLSPGSADSHILGRRGWSSKGG